MTEPFQIVNQSDGPPPRAWTKVYAYDASGNLEYEGWAESTQDWTEWNVASARLTSIVDVGTTSTATFGAAHGLEVEHEIEVKNASASALNGTFKVATVPLTTTITFTTSGVADATYNNNPLMIRSRAPRKNDAIWVIKKYFYTTGNLVGIKWAKGQAQTPNLVWDDRTTYDYR